MKEFVLSEKREELLNEIKNSNWSSSTKTICLMLLLKVNNEEKEFIKRLKIQAKFSEDKDYFTFWIDKLAGDNLVEAKGE